jgi:hypothetical protein
MPQADPKDELWAEVERHPAALAHDGEGRLRGIISAGAEKLAAEPERSDEAMANLRLLLDRAAEMSAEREGDADVAVLDVAVSETGIELALRDLCPIFPFC